MSEKMNFPRMAVGELQHFEKRALPNEPSCRAEVPRLQDEGGSCSAGESLGEG